MSIITHALVTGANGFIGSNLCRLLRARDIPVRALVLAGTDTSNIAQPGIEIVTADIGVALDPALFAGISHVFHLAAIALDWGPDALFERVNVGGTRHVLEASLAAGVAHVVHVSSLAVHPYVGHPDGSESTPRGWDLNAYTRTKNRAEDVVQSFRKKLAVTVIRPGVVPYGPGDRLSMPGIVDALARGIYAHVGGGNTRVCLSYVENLVEGMLLAACREGDSGEVYVLSDDIVTWREFIDSVADAFGVPRARRTIPFALAWAVAVVCEWAWKFLPLRGVPPLTRYRISLFRGDLVFSNHKARRELGYVPRVGLKEGLDRTRRGL